MPGMLSWPILRNRILFPVLRVCLPSVAAAEKRRRCTAETRQWMKMMPCALKDLEGLHCNFIFLGLFVHLFWDSCFLEGSSVVCACLCVLALIRIHVHFL